MLPATTGFSQGTQRTRNSIGTGDVNDDGVPDLLIGMAHFMNGPSRQTPKALLLDAPTSDYRDRISWRMKTP